MPEVFTAQTRLSPYWWEAAPRRPLRPVTVPRKADVVVVGAGYTGLCAALTLASRGVETVVLDAEAPGAGASSRNGGMVGPAFHLAGAAALERRFGAERARAVLEEGLAMVRHLEATIATEGIDCQYRRSGRFTGAVSRRGYERMERALDANRKLVNFAGEMLPRTRQREEIGSDCFYGGLVLAADGGLHPGLYHEGLLAAAERRGARVVGHAPAGRVTRAGGKLLISTPRGEIAAEQAIVATNGYTGPAFPSLRRRLIPVRSAMIATEEIDADVLTRLMPKSRMLTDSRRVGHYFRPSPDGRRILFGGRVIGEVRTRDDAHLNALYLHRAMTAIFPELASTRIAHYWDGLVAFTFDRLPHLGSAGGLHYAMGYCGSGVARAGWFGRKIALAVLGDPERASAFDGIPFQTRPLYGGSPWFLPGLIFWYRTLDRLGL
jgi:glycine/D-amino acid oxidase-like deaminating enzyme